MTTAPSPIILVDQYTGYDGEHDNQNRGVHPAETGEVKIATGGMMHLSHSSPSP